MYLKLLKEFLIIIFNCLKWRVNVFVYLLLFCLLFVKKFGSGKL